MKKFKRLKRFKQRHAKWGIILPYLLLSLFLWQHREAVYEHLAIFEQITWGDKLLDALFFSLSFAGFAVLYRTLRTPPWNVARFNEAIKDAGIANAAGEKPCLVAAYRDIDKKHGTIYEAKDKGVCVEDWDRKASSMSSALGHIYSIDLGRHARTIRLYAIPRKYFVPTPITINDDAIGQTSVANLINFLCVGDTGTGKTVAMKSIIYKLLTYTVAEVWIIDVKNQDFTFLSGLADHYYSYSDATQGLFDYYAAFKEQQAAGKVSRPQILAIDEWAALLLSCPDKKTSERCKAILAEILMTGRSYKYIPLIGVQKGYADLFGGGRDNFSACLALGNLSREAKRMVAGDDAGQLSEKNRTGEGYLLLDGRSPERVRVMIDSVDALDRKIMELLRRRKAERGGGEAEREPPPVPPAAGGGGLT